MTHSKKVAALAVGFAALLSFATLAPTLSAQNTKAMAETLVVEDASIDWIERSNVAALREGVIDRMELQIGMPVAKGKPIGYLHREIAELTVQRQRLANAQTLQVFAATGRDRLHDEEGSIVETLGKLFNREHMHQCCG